MSYRGGGAAYTGTQGPGLHRAYRGLRPIHRAYRGPGTLQCRFEATERESLAQRSPKTRRAGAEPHSVYRAFAKEI
jgi:hypothetical protein